ncbi:MAG: amidohydrolase family protein [Pseudomonadota bacterium]
MPIDFFEGVPLVDHHVHGVMNSPLDADGVLAIMSESSRPPPPGTTNFMKPVGLAVRRDCAPVLDLPSLASGQAYLDRRHELGHDEVNARLLTQSGVAAWLVDTGNRSDAVEQPDGMERISGAMAREVIRIELVIEEQAQHATSGADLMARVRDRLTAATKTIVGFKSIAAYRVSFKIDQTPIDDATAEAAADRWLMTLKNGETNRLDDVDVIRFGLWTAGDLARTHKLPIQLHVGVGDDDVYMHACDPTHFTDFVKAMDAWDVPITLLHCFPFVRESCWMAEVFRNVYFDVGFTVNFTGPQGATAIREALEMSPFYKFLYSSDAFGLPELHYLGAVLFKREFNALMTQWVETGWATEDDAYEIARMVGYENAARIYPGLEGLAT